MRYFDECMNLDDLRRRYKEWVVKLHPDRHTQDSPEERAQAERDFKDMQAQYECREAELKGDYSKSHKYQRETERERKEREERERREEARRRVERVVEEARKNRAKPIGDLKEGDYIYARRVKTSFNPWENNTIEEVMETLATAGVIEECVVKIEWIETFIPTADFYQMRCNTSLEGIGMPLGGYEVLSVEDASYGRKKGKRVAKVVLFRSNDGATAIMGNPMGDQSVRDYYVTDCWQTMFGTKLDAIRAKLAYEAAEKQRLEEERKAKLLVEQKPLIEEWQDRLIEVSRGLSQSEREAVAVNNLRSMLKSKFQGTAFKVVKDRAWNTMKVQWEDGPTVSEVEYVTNLFDLVETDDDKMTPWMERFGVIKIATMERKMSALTKARILQQLGQVTMVFRDAMMLDEVPMSDFDWMMLHAMVGLEVGKLDRKEQCRHDIHPDGHRSTTPHWAVKFIFNHTSYQKQRKPTPKRKSSQKN